MEKNELKEFIELVLEARLREVDVTDGKASHGSEEHIIDLQKRLEHYTEWRDKKRKGSDDRANYARIITRLKAELKSAQRQAAKELAKKVSESQKKSSK